MQKITSGPTIQRKPMVCAEHGEYQAIYFPHYELWAQCPTCQEKADKARAAEEKEAEKLRVFQARLDYAGLSKRFADKGFDNYLPATSAQRKILDLVQGYADNFARNLESGRCLALIGDVGNGKTHLGVSVLRSVIMQGYSARYVRAYDLYKAIKESWNGIGNKRSETEAMEDFTKPDLLVIDEIGVQFGTGTEETLMINVIDARYNAMLPTVAISNLPRPKEDKNRPFGTEEERRRKPVDLEDALGSRAYDRLIENDGLVLEFHGKSFRRIPQSPSQPAEAWQ